MNFIGCDFESSGSDPWGLSVPIQIGIALPDGANFISDIGGWDWGYHEWSEESLEVHKIPKSAIDASEPVWKVDIRAANFLLENISGQRMNNIIVGYNVGSFDRAFVTRWMPSLNRILSYRTCDLNSVIYGMTDDEKGFAKLKNASKAYAEEKMGGSAAWHNALYDARAALYSLEYLRERNGVSAVDGE